MNDALFQDDLLELLGELCNGDISDARRERLETMLGRDPEARRTYVKYLDLHLALTDIEVIGAEPESADEANNKQTPPLPYVLPTDVHHVASSYLSGWPAAYLIATVICGIGLTIAAFTYISQPTDIAQHSNNFNPQSLISNPSPKATIVARITGTADCRWEKRGLGIRDWGLEEGSRFKVQGSSSKQLQSRASKSRNPQIPKSLVSLGDQFILSAGLMEITYNTGARVILQGPCTYEVDSAAGGFLTVGKLTARVEKSTKYGVQSTELVASGQWLVASDEMQNEKCKLQNAKLANSKSPNPQIPKSPNSQLTTNHDPPSTTSNPQSLIPNPSSSPQPLVPSPLFAVRTPTATITDLGTEFGVEVDKAGGTTSHVFQGSIRVQQRAADGTVQSDGRVVRESQTVRVDSSTGNRQIIALHAFTPSHFVREIPEHALSQPADAPTEAAYIEAVLADKPMGYWPLNEPAGSHKFMDRSGNGIHGYAMNKVAAGQPGPLGAGSRAAGFDGRDYIDFGRRDQFAMPNNFTVEAWVWIGNAQGSSQVISALGQGTSSHSGWGLNVHPLHPGPKGAKNPVVFDLGLYCVGASPFVLRDGESIEARWLHVAVAFDGTNTSHLYLDGKHRGSVTIGKPAGLGPTWLQIGTAQLIDEDFWRGRLAHVAVYPHVLSPEQISNHFNQSHAGGREVNRQTQ